MWNFRIFLFSQRYYTIRITLSWHPRVTGGILSMCRSIHNFSHWLRSATSNLRCLRSSRSADVLPFFTSRLSVDSLLPVILTACWSDTLCMVVPFQVHRFHYETMTGRCWFRKVSSYEKAGGTAPRELSHEKRFRFRDFHHRTPPAALPCFSPIFALKPLFMRSQWFDKHFRRTAKTSHPLFT